jgi:hypothetical protein
MTPVGAAPHGPAASRLMVSTLTPGAIPLLPIPTLGLRLLPLNNIG